MSFFEKVPLAPVDPILGLPAAFQKDPRPHKVNLGVGVYKTEDLRTPVLECVKLAEAYLLENEQNKEYLPIEGMSSYLQRMGALIFGESSWNKEKNRIASFQTIGGTGALKIGGTLLKEEIDHPLWIPAPTWPNHRGVFSACGLKVNEYPYYNVGRHCAQFEEMQDCLQTLAEGSIVLLQASCQNPTGCDLTLEQWSILSTLFQQKRLIPFFDCAYQGLGRGMGEDVEAIRLFLQNGHEMLVAVSNAKNLSLYAERLGCLFIISASSKTSQHIHSRVKQMIRTNYSNPPKHAAATAAHIFEIPVLYQKWQDELSMMRHRIHQMRMILMQKLRDKIPQKDLSHLEKGIGMFGFLALQSSQVQQLIKDYGIYMPSDGRINVCGLNHNNIDFVVNAIKEVLLKDA